MSNYSDSAVDAVTSAHPVPDDVRLLHRHTAAPAAAPRASMSWTSLAMKAAAAVIVLVVLAWLLNTRGYAGSDPPTTPSGRRSLLVISMDGFRANYMQSHAQFLPNIRGFFREGVKSKGIRPSFPSLTFPNHYTIATGLYPSAHGIIANSFINPTTAARFSMGSGSLEPQWWGGEPLWVTARKAGLNAYVYFWPGSEVELHGFRPTQYRKYSDDEPYMQRVSTVVDWISNAPNGNADLVMMYFNQPDHDNHAHGPNSTEVTSAILVMDFYFGQLISKLAAAGVLPAVDIVLLADHGVSEISLDRTVSMNIPSNLAAYVTGAPVTQIWPKDVHLGTLGNASSAEFLAWSANIRGPLMQFANASGGHLSVFARDDVPAYLHYTGPLVSPYVAITAPGWMVSNLYPRYPTPNKGAHGFDPTLGEDMWAVLQMKGPRINAKAHLHSVVENVHLYNMFCSLLRIRPAPNNGTQDLAKQVIL